MADMDIEMDLDLGFTAEDLAIPARDVAIAQDVTPIPPQNDLKPILSTPNDTTEPNATEPVPEKVHLRGLDNLTTNDIKAFTSEYFPVYVPKIEWINDTSANLVYESPDIARQALAAFAAVELFDQTPILQTVQAKPFPLHPETNLEVRLAVVGDRKKRGARNESRFYLQNPQYDPGERRRGPRRYRDRDDGGYRSQRYDDHEQHKREREADFDASLYDDDDVAIAKRAGRDNNGRDSSSGGDSRGQRRGGYHRASKELFPEGERRASGRLRNRSASPIRDADGDEGMKESRIAQRRQDSAAAANRLKAQTIKARLRESSAPKELFPEKAFSKSRRTVALDTADETADLFANKMVVPFMDGSNDVYVRNGGSLESRIGRLKSGNEPSGFAIRGAASASPTLTPTFNIKGAAKVKELFPATLGDNSGKELFSDKLEGRGRRRQKAEDLFY